MGGGGGGRGFCTTLRKQDYSNILKILPPEKNENFQIKKNLIFFHISAQNIDFGYSLEPPRRGSSNEYLLSMFSSRNKKNKYTLKRHSIDVHGISEVRFINTSKPRKYLLPDIQTPRPWAFLGREIFRIKPSPSCVSGRP